MQQMRLLKSRSSDPPSQHAKDDQRGLERQEDSLPPLTSRPHVAPPNGEAREREKQGRDGWRVDELKHKPNV